MTLTMKPGVNYAATQGEVREALDAMIDGWLDQTSAGQASVEAMGRERARKAMIRLLDKRVVGVEIIDKDEGRYAISVLS